MHKDWNTFTEGFFLNTVYKMLRKVLRQVSLCDFSLMKTVNRREEARKATELQPQMSAEAKRMVTKLAVR